ncbi:MAG: glycoside hydrolase family 18 protein, partial [Nitrosopumilus sp.]|nr:glycoside hydrolase family 18 protein [Nitrosopumilus sp.]
MKFAKVVNNTQQSTPIIFGILIILLGFQFIPMNIQTADAMSKKIVGYFPYWESRNIDSIDYSSLTEIIYFHIWPNSDGSLNTGAINTNDLKTIRDKTHEMGIKVTISVGGWGASDGFPPMSKDPTARANFVSNIADFVLKNNLDGVDINWETP